MSRIATPGSRGNRDWCACDACACGHSEDNCPRCGYPHPLAAEEAFYVAAYPDAVAPGPKSIDTKRIRAANNVVHFRPGAPVTSTRKPRGLIYAFLGVTHCDECGITFTCPKCHAPQ